MADIFREVDEDVRNDRAAKAFAKYQPYLIGLALLVVIATVGYRLYENNRIAAAEALGAQYETALQLVREGKGKDAEAALESLAKTAPSGYRALALLRAAAEIGSRDAAGGASAFDALAAKSELGPQFQDIARLRAAMLMLDDSDPKEILRRLEPMTGADQPFRNSARELLAASALAHNDLESAGKWLDMVIVDPQSPPDMRNRAEEMAGLIAGGKKSGPK